MSNSVKSKGKFNFQEWWTSPGVKRAVGVVYSLGASVVIIGAMFKILHLPGAGFMLGAGLIIEALLFVLGAFDKPHPDYHWDHVFPNLTEKEAKPFNYNNIGGGGAAAGSGIPNVGEISDKDAAKITESINKLTETAKQLANISKAADATSAYAESLAKATTATDNYVAKQQNLGNVSDGLLTSYNGVASTLDGVTSKIGVMGSQIDSINSNTSSIIERTGEMNKNIGAINTAYELQVKNIDIQSKAIAAQSEKIGAITANYAKIEEGVSDTIKSIEGYKLVADQLQKNVSELNNVYGNMLNAIKA